MMLLLLLNSVGAVVQNDITITRRSMIIQHARRAIARRCAIAAVWEQASAGWCCSRAIVPLLPKYDAVALRLQRSINEE
jgi:hypothetical protein